MGFMGTHSRWIWMAWLRYEMLSFEWEWFLHWKERCSGMAKRMTFWFPWVLMKNDYFFILKNAFQKPWRTPGETWSSWEIITFNVHVELLRPFSCCAEACSSSQTPEEPPLLSRDGHWNWTRISVQISVVGDSHRATSCWFLPCEPPLPKSTSQYYYCHPALHCIIFSIGSLFI